MVTKGPTNHLDLSMISPMVVAAVVSSHPLEYPYSVLSIVAGINVLSNPHNIARAGSVTVVSLIKALITDQQSVSLLLAALELIFMINLHFSSCCAWSPS